LAKTIKGLKGKGETFYVEGGGVYVQQGRRTDATYSGLKGRDFMLDGYKGRGGKQVATLGFEKRDAHKGDSNLVKDVLLRDITKESLKKRKKRFL